MLQMTQTATPMPPLLVGSIEAVARSRLLTASVSSRLIDVAALLSSAQIRPWARWRLTRLRDASKDQSKNVIGVRAATG